MERFEIPLGDLAGGGGPTVLTVSASTPPRCDEVRQAVRLLSNPSSVPRPDPIASEPEPAAHGEGTDAERWTVAASRYWEASAQSISFVAFTWDLASRGDEVAQIAARALAFGENDPAKKAELEKTASDTPRADAFERWKRWLSEVVLCRSVDNLLTYISDAHFLIYEQRPEALRSREQVRLDFVLQHDSMTDLLAALAERRVDRLAYKGLTDVSDELSTSLGLSLFPDAEIAASAVLAVDQRNLIVHNRGVINTRWVARHGEDRGRLGDPLSFGNPVDTSRQLDAVVRHVDPQLASKFGVERSTVAVPGP